MILKMANPWKHPITGVYYYRQRPPSRIAERLKGVRLGLTVNGKPAPTVVQHVVKVSLRTKEPVLARQRYRDVSQQVAQLCEAYDGDAFTLSHEQVNQLAGEWYRSIVGAYRANPGDAEGWDVELYRVGEALEHFVPDDEPDYPSRDRLPYNPERGERLIGQYLKPDIFLQERGLRLSPQSRLAFLREAGHAHIMACSQSMRHADGDYAPDEGARRFPSEPFKRQSQDLSADIWALVDAWALERKPRAQPIQGCKFAIGQFVGQFVDSAGHTDARRYSRRDVLKWKDGMVAAGSQPSQSTTRNWLS